MYRFLFFFCSFLLQEMLAHVLLHVLASRVLREPGNSGVMATASW